MMDALDAPAAFVAAILLVSFIAVSRGIDAAEAARGRAGWKLNLLLWTMLGSAAYGVFYGLDHPFWGDVISSVGGGLIAVAVIVLAGALLRFLRGEQSRK